MRPVDPTRNIERRDVLRIGALSVFGLGLADRFRLAAETPGSRKSCILIWLDGGPSHLETFDPKPEAPREVRGPFGTVETPIPGIRFSEHLAATAKVASKLAVIRSLTSNLGEHDFGSHYLLSGYRPNPSLVYPSWGSLVAHLGDAKPAVPLPRYIQIGDRANLYAANGYLPQSATPFAPGGDPARPDFRVRDLSPYPGVSAERLERRRDFRAALDRFHRTADEAAGDLPAEFAKAYELIQSADAKKAFELDDETGAMRDRYGRRTLGQSCLLARRLVERGVGFVTVTDRGWDTHEDLKTRLEEGYTGGRVGKVPVLDQALAALIGDLDDRGLLDETLVVVMGEFGRTPKLNTASGRDHWPRAFSVALAGGGVRGGQVIGSSDAHGESPRERALSPSDLSRSVLEILGLDPHRELHTADGRPVKLSAGAERIDELLG